MPASKYLGNLCDLYDAYNRREFVHPDPLEFLYEFEDVRDREIVGLISSSLAYGGVKQILKSVQTVLNKMPEPSRFIRNSTRSDLHELFSGFRHRFTTGAEMATMLYGVKTVLEKYGTLDECFRKGLSNDAETVLPALDAFVTELTAVFEGKPPSLLPSPAKGSACKRLNLYLRWMVRKDNVDPGGWDGIPTSRLVVPVDVHMHRISSSLGLTARKSADMKTAIEITRAFRKISPDDPVRYDFCLTRLGIRDDLDPARFLEACEISTK
jgi:uncharacterized protein (TIGR02757 family)